MILKIFFLKSMILNEKVFVKSMILNEENFVKSMIFNYIFFVLSGFERILFRSSGFELNFFVFLDFESRFLQRESFEIKNFTTRQILNKSPKSTTCTFHIALLHITMYSYRLQNLHRLDNSIRHRSNNTFVLFFARSFTFDFTLVSHILV